MRIFALALISTAVIAQTQMVEIPQSLKNPGQPRWAVPAVPTKVLKAEEAPAVCSVPLLRVPIQEGARITVVQPNTGSNMPVLRPPAPPCETEPAPQSAPITK